MTEPHIIETIGHLVFARPDYKNAMAEALGISRNYLDKLLTMEKLDQKDRLMILGFIDDSRAVLLERVRELGEIKAASYGKRDD